MIDDLFNLVVYIILGSGFYVIVLSLGIYFRSYFNYKAGLLKGWAFLSLLIDIPLTVFPIPFLICLMTNTSYTEPGIDPLSIINLLQTYDFIGTVFLLIIVDIYLIRFIYWLYNILKSKFGLSEMSFWAKFFINTIVAVFIFRMSAFFIGQWTLQESGSVLHYLASYPNTPLRLSLIWQKSVVVLSAIGFGDVFASLINGVIFIGAFGSGVQVISKTIRYINKQKWLPQIHR